MNISRQDAQGNTSEHTIITWNFPLKPMFLLLNTCLVLSLTIPSLPKKLKTLRTYPNKWWVNRSPKWNTDLLMVLAHPENWDSSCRGSVPLLTCTHVCSITEHWWHLKMKLSWKNLIHMSILVAWLLWRRLFQEHSAVFLWIQWHYFQAFKMCLGVVLCLVLLEYRCKYFKVFTTARKVTTWELAGSCSPPAKTSLVQKSPFCQWMGWWVARWRPHVWEVPRQTQSQFLRSSSMIPFSSAAFPMCGWGRSV